MKSRKTYGAAWRGGGYNHDLVKVKNEDPWLVSWQPSTTAHIKLKRSRGGKAGRDSPPCQSHPVGLKNLVRPIATATKKGHQSGRAHFLEEKSREYLLRLAHVTSFRFAAASRVFGPEPPFFPSLDNQVYRQSLGEETHPVARQVICTLSSSEPTSISALNYRLL